MCAAGGVWNTNNAKLPEHTKYAKIGPRPAIDTTRREGVEDREEFRRTMVWALAIKGRTTVTNLT